MIVLVLTDSLHSGVPIALSIHFDLSQKAKSDSIATFAGSYLPWKTFFHVRDSLRHLAVRAVDAKRLGVPAQGH